ncbi:tetratricopeptide repeat protein [uncultured Kordia sp.]|uniref:tetratricopeptide repeat protein n=1 Tax=uncultured Kordia sp. TaxID=507699 RepID=UPI00261AA498|nr:tetratricopeptide repeat protein [uncultured Kordia sp.]
MRRIENYLPLILNNSIARWLRLSVCKFHICFFILCFFTIISNAQKDSVEVEKLYKTGFEKLRIKPQKSIANFENAIAIIDSSDLLKAENKNYFLLKKALMLDQLGHYYRVDTEFVSSLKVLQESLKIKESIGETYTLSTTYRSLGRLYLHKKDTVKGYQFYNKAFDASKKYKNAKEHVNDLSALSAYYLSHNQHEKGKVYAEKALKYADSIGYSKGKSSAIFRFSRYARIKKDYQTAISYSKENSKICKENNDNISLEKVYKNLGYAYRKLKQPEKAVLYYKKSLDLLIEIGLEGHIANRCLSLSNAYTDLGNHERAFAYYRGYKRQQIKDMNIKSVKEFAELEAKYAYEQQKVIDSIRFTEIQKIKESQILEEASTKFWKVTTIIATIFGIIIAIIIFLLRKRREQVKLGELKNKMLQNEIDYKQKDISDFALNISRNHKWREELLKHIKKIKKSSSVKEDANFKALEKAILDREIVDNSAIDFQNKVDVLNTAFYEKLHEKYPTLTKTEVKLCSLIRLNIDNNEIAILQNVALESVYRSRSRLRKKLNLSPEEDLNALLRKL